MSENPVKSLKALHRLLYDKYIPYYIIIYIDLFYPISTKLANCRILELKKWSEKKTNAVFTE